MLSSADGRNRRCQSPQQCRSEIVPRSSSAPSFKILFSFTDKEHLIVLIPAIALVAVAGTIEPVASILVGKLMNSFSQFSVGNIDENAFTDDTRPWIFALVILGFSTWVLKGLSYSLWIGYGEVQAKVVREELFSNLICRDLEWFEAQQSGVSSLLNRIQVQIREFQLSVSQPLGLALLTLSQTIFSLGVAFYYSWKLTLALLAAFPLIAFGLFWISRGLQNAINDQQKAMMEAAKQANHTICNIDVLKCFNGLPDEAKRYNRSLQLIFRHYHKQAAIAARQIAFMRVAAGLLVVIALLFGAYVVHKDGTNPGEILSTFWCCVTASKGFDEVLTQILVLEKGRASAATLKYLINPVRKSKRTVQRHKYQVPSLLHGNIEFQNVSFTYPSNPGRQILRHTNLSFPAQETSFVIGKSGSGKSTLASLLLKFYDPREGRILIDGNDLQTLDTNWLRNNLTLVPQDSILFNDTLATNIALGHRDPTRPSELNIWQSVKFAILDETARHLPEGIYSKIGKGGSSLSGGQRQRVALARARVRDSPVLILDEATSALDHSTKVSVLKNIREWRRGRTTIVITHDASQIEPGDFVRVLQNGTVLAAGRRSTLETELGQSLSGNDVEKALDSPSRVEKYLIECDPRSICQTTSLRQSNASRGSLSSNTNYNMIENERALLHHPGGMSLNQKNRNKRFAVHFGGESEQFYQRFNGGDADPGNTLRQEHCSKRSARPYTMYNLKRLTIAEAARPYSVYPSLHVRARDQYDEYPIESSPSQVQDSKLSDSSDSATVSPEHRDEDPIQSKEWISLYSILLSVWSFLQPTDRRRLLFAISSATLYSAIPAASSWVAVHLFETFSQADGWVQEAVKWSLILIAIVSGEGIVAFSIHILFEALAQAWINALRLKAFVAILNQPKSWFDDDKYSPTRLCTTLDRAAEEMRNILGRFIPFALIAVMMVLISIIWCFLTCWKLTLMSLGCVPIVYLVSKLFEVTSKFWEAQTSSAADKVSDVFEESFLDVRTVRAFALESYFHKKHKIAVSQALAAGMKRSFFIGICFGLSDSTVPFMIAGVFKCAIVVAEAQGFSVKDILVVLSMLVSTAISLGAILAFIPQISSSIESGARLLPLATLSSGFGRSSGQLKFNAEYHSSDIEISNLSFAYSKRPNVLVLRDLNLSIRAGQCTVIVGASGSGKSTIISLILGLYPIKDYASKIARIQISDHDIEDFDMSSLRSHMAYVSQRPVLFPMSIRENILYCTRIDSPSREGVLYSAARSAGIHDFVMSLPKSYDTVIGDGGMNLSGGQAQRIAVARALARRPVMLLMDEPTSALDPENAAIIRSSIREYKKHCGGGHPTVIIVTHSRDMMQLADNVVMLEAGRVVEEGTFGEVMGRRGKLWNMLNRTE